MSTPVSRFASFDHLRVGLLLLTMVAAVSLSAQTGAYTLNGGTATQTGQTYSATETDQSAVYVLNGGQLTLNQCTMTKSGDASDVNESSEYGINAGVLATSSSVITLNGGSVTTGASGANGLFATGSGSSITMSDGVIVAIGGGAHGVDATYGGAIVLSNVDVTTNGSNSSAIATDFGGGTVTVTGGTIVSADTTDGSHSAGLYSTGTITVTGANVSSLADNGGMIDGSNSIILVDTGLNGAKNGVKTWKTAPASGSATVSVSGGSVTAETGAAFWVSGETGTAATTNVTVQNGAEIHSGCGQIIKVTDSSTGTLLLDNVAVSGELYADDTSTLNCTLQNGTTWTGTASNASLTLDAGSVWILSASSLVNILSNSAGISGTTVTNIQGNGHNLYYNSSLSGNSYLGGLTYTLVNGGYLLPGTTSNDDGSVASGKDFLAQNYPNPFNPSTTICFNLVQSGHITLQILNVRGQNVCTLADGEFSAGQHSLTWNGSDAEGRHVASGVYFYRLQSGQTTQMRKMMLMK